MSYKVSIQIPTYNQEHLILRAVQSALAQSYKNLEVIVADDCSTDETEKVVANITDARLKYYRNTKNLGRVENYRNSLNNYCTGDWVVNLDGDDYFTDVNFVNRAVSALGENTDAVLYIGQNSYLKKIAKIHHKAMNNSEISLSGLEFLERYSDYPCFFHLACIYDRKKAVENNFYDVDCLTADFVSLMRLADDGDFIISEKPVGTWDVNTNSASQTLNTVNNNKNIDGLEKLFESLHYDSDEQKKKIKEELSYVNKYHLLSATATRKDFLRSLLQFFELFDLKKQYYLKGFLRFLIKG